MAVGTAVPDLRRALMIPHTLIFCSTAFALLQDRLECSHCQVGHVLFYGQKPRDLPLSLPPGQV